MTNRIGALAELHPRYDVVLSDVWGVLHNGVTPWQDACNALTQARKAGLGIALITNSPRRRDAVARQLDEIGVPRSAYDRLVTSGDVTRKLISKGPKKIFFLGLDRDLTLFEGLDIELVDRQDAEAVVCTGPYDDVNDDPEDYREMFAPLVERGLPFICANPDLVVERGDKLVICAGSLAKVYREMGGETRIAGKPYAAMYDTALAELSELRGAAVDPAKAVAIGDGLPTDVHGALNYGLDLLYIAHGIHARDYSRDGAIDEALLDGYLKEKDVSPNFWMPRLA